MKFLLELLFGNELRQALYKVLELLGNIMTTQAELATQLVALKDTIVKTTAETQLKLDELAAALAANGEVSPEVAAALDALTVAVAAQDALVPDVTPW